MFLSSNGNAIDIYKNIFFDNTPSSFFFTGNISGVQDYLKIKIYFNYSLYTIFSLLNMKLINQNGFFFIHNDKITPITPINFFNATCFFLPMNMTVILEEGFEFLNTEFFSILITDRIYISTKFMNYNLYEYYILQKPVETISLNHYFFHKAFGIVFFDDLVVDLNKQKIENLLNWYYSNNVIINMINTSVFIQDNVYFNNPLGLFIIMTNFLLTIDQFNNNYKIICNNLLLTPKNIKTNMEFIIFQRNGLENFLLNHEIFSEIFIKTVSTDTYMILQIKSDESKELFILWYDNIIKSIIIRDKKSFY